MDNFWTRVHYLPTQTDFLDLEEVNPAEAYRRQAVAINEAGPLYAELETVEEKLGRIDRALNSVKKRILSQNMPVPSSSTRNNDLVDAFVLHCSKTYENSKGDVVDVSEKLIRMERHKSILESRRDKLSRRIRAIESMADKCDRIMNWAKHEARLERHG